MLTTSNYFTQTRNIDFDKLPETLKKGDAFVRKVTSDGASWDQYRDSEGIHRMIDVYFERLNKHLSELSPAPIADKRTKGSPAKVKVQPSNDPVEVLKDGNISASLVERIPEEIRFIKRFVNLNGKVKTKDEILRFINSLQKAIVEKRIRKTSLYADDIRLVQEKIIGCYNTMEDSHTVTISSSTLEQLTKSVFAEKVLPSINFIKRYIAINGKIDIKDKAAKLLEQLTRALEKGIINSGDPYYRPIGVIRDNLESFTSQKKEKMLIIEKSELNGLRGILNGCECETHLGKLPQTMNSMDFAKVVFETIGFKGKWLDFFGDPGYGFAIMVLGPPKFGKSIFGFNLAGYLARNHGKTLYASTEEQLHKTLQDKINRDNIKHPNLYVSSTVPDDLSPYAFVFIDSVTNFKLKPEDLNRLRSNYPKISFIFIFQVTKSGKFRGDNSFQHDVDSVVEMVAPGKAVQMGRYNQGGEMDVFEKKAA